MAPTYNQIRPKFSHDSIAKAHRQRELSLDCKSGFLECESKCLHINRFQKAMPKLIVYLKEDSNNPLCKLLVFHSVSSQCSSVATGQFNGKVGSSPEPFVSVSFGS